MSKTWLSGLRTRSLALRMSLLAAVTLVAFALALPVALAVGGSRGVWASGVAAFLCLAGAAAALWASDRFRGPERFLYGVLLGIAGRMGVPLGFGLLLYFFCRALAQAGILYYLLVFYPVTLAVETVLSLPPQQRPASGDAQDKSADG